MAQGSLWIKQDSLNSERRNFCLVAGGDLFLDSKSRLALGLWAGREAAVKGTYLQRQDSVGRAPPVSSERGGVSDVGAQPAPFSSEPGRRGKKGSSRMPCSVIFLLHIKPHTSGLEHSVAHHTSNCPGAVGTLVSAHSG